MTKKPCRYCGVECGGTGIAPHEEKCKKLSPPEREAAKIKLGQRREWAARKQGGGGTMVQINFCPSCGTRIPNAFAGGVK